MLRRLRTGILVLLIIALPYGAYAGFLQLSGNFHPVIEGELYRSAQPTAAQIVKYKLHHGIKTIINLRGRNGHRRWYRDEVKVARLLGITHVNFRMSASKVLGYTKAARLLSLLKTAEKPILIHCAGGADRSGLAVALYLGSEGYGEEAAKAQLSLLFGHIGIPYLSSTYAMDRSINRLETWLDFNDS
jgi:protein tyrosine/serine phosphatase